MSKIISYEAKWGQELLNLVDKIVALAKQERKSVKTVLNGITLIATPESLESDSVIYYYSEREKRREELGKFAAEFSANILSTKEKKEMTALYAKILDYFTNLYPEKTLREIRRMIEESINSCCSAAENEEAYRRWMHFINPRVYRWNKVEKAKEEKKYFGIDISKIDEGVEINGAWDRKSNGRSVKVICLGLVKGDPEEHFKDNYPKTVSKVIGPLKEAIVQID